MLWADTSGMPLIHDVKRRYVPLRYRFVRFGTFPNAKATAVPPSAPRSFPDTTTPTTLDNVLPITSPPQQCHQEQTQPMPTTRPFHHYARLRSRLVTFGTFPNAKATAVPPPGPRAFPVTTTPTTLDNVLPITSPPQQCHHEQTQPMPTTGTLHHYAQVRSRLVTFVTFPNAEATAVPPRPSSVTTTPTTLDNVLPITSPPQQCHHEQTQPMPTTSPLHHYSQARFKFVTFGTFPNAKATTMPPPTPRSFPDTTTPTTLDNVLPSHHHHNNATTNKHNLCQPQVRSITTHSSGPGL